MRIPGNVTHTFAELEVSAAAYDEIAAKLREAGYDHAFTDEGAIDMHGIGLVREQDSQRASSSAGSADAVSPATPAAAVPSPSGTADQAVLQPWQQRVVDEKRELDEKLAKLAVFREAEAFLRLAPNDQALLHSQQTAMRCYSTVLGLRIAGFTNQSPTLAKDLAAKGMAGYFDRLFAETYTKAVRP